MVLPITFACSRATFASEGARAFVFEGVESVLLLGQPSRSISRAAEEDCRLPPSDVARANAALRRLELVVGMAGFIIALPLIGGSPRSATGQMLGYFGASLLVLAAGFLSASFLAQARLRAAAGLTPPPAAPAAPYDSSPKAWVRAQAAHLRDRVAAVDWLGDWAPVVIPFLLASIAIVTLVMLWPTRGQAIPAPLVFQLLAGGLIVAAFPLLVLERYYAGLSTSVLPDAAKLARLVRVPLLAAVGLSIAAIFRSLGFAWPVFISQAVAIVVGIVAAEIALRCAAFVFMPLAPLAVRGVPAESALADLIRLERPSWRAINFAVQRQLGIDLSRSWAIAFVQRAARPVLGGMIVFAWLLTGVTALGLSQRAVYEQFGVPVSVFGPGLHIHLPWPFGILHDVEYGTVHEIPIVFGAAERTTTEAAEVVPAEAAPPPGADRLWDASHPSEASYLVAANSEGRQNFQIVNIDLRIVYRIGLTDDAARAAAYRIADPEALIRAAAGRMLVRHFARYTLLDVLGQNRAAFVEAFKAQLQQRLDALASGIDVIAVVVEAIHPPPDAARAYHDVQAAQITSIAQVAVSRADAARKMKAAAQTSVELTDEAQAAAAERVDQAQADATLFGGDRQAYAAGGPAFLFERWVEHLNKGLSLAPLVIIDNRLGGQNAPTIDLRKIGPATAPTLNDND